MDIGFIGFGNIRFPMARRLLAAGHALFVHELNLKPLERLQAEGAAIVAWQFTCSQPGPDADSTGIVQLNEKWAGLEVRDHNTSEDRSQ